MTAVRRDQGFTLVEVLVVVLILGILSAIAIPIYSAQRERAFRAALASDMHALQLAQAARAVESDPHYTDDLDDLRSQGFRQSAGVVDVTVDLFEHDGDEEYVACLRHDGFDEWLVYSSLDGRQTYSTTQCAAA